MDELAKYFDRNFLSGNVIDRESLERSLKEYLGENDIAPEVIEAVGDRVLDTINSNRRARGLKELFDIRGKRDFPKTRKVFGHKRSGRPVKPYFKSKPKSFSKAEEQFIRERINLKTSLLIKRFNERFENRSASSIYTKKSRLKNV